MSAHNESAISLRWLLDDIEEPLAAAWSEVRDQMRRPTGQTISSLVDWISDPWIAKGVRATDVMRTAIPMWAPPENFDEWPSFGVKALLAAASVPVTPTRNDTLSAILAAAPVDTLGAAGALEEFNAWEGLIQQHGDQHMILGDQVRAWVLAAVGSLLRGIAFTSTEVDPEAIANVTAFRMGIPSQLQLPRNWVISNFFGERHLELLLNMTIQANGELAPLDPADLRVGQGLQWKLAWGWLSRDVPAELTLSAIQMAARLLRSIGLRLGLHRCVTSSDANLRTLATGVLRRWVLTLKAMAWAEHALSLPWDVVRPADIACMAFSAIKPEWPRRLFAISHRSGEVKPALRHLQAWKSCRYAIDATYIPAWETNTGMIWGLFATPPLIARVRSPGYETSVWCRREAEMVQHLIDRADYCASRVAVDVDPDQLHALAKWSAIVQGNSGDAPAIEEPQFPPSMLQVWSPRPSPEWELAVQRAAGALRAINSFIGDASLANRIVEQLIARGDFPGPAPTNQPGGWRPYAAIFQRVAALGGPSSPDVVPLRFPENYSQEDIARDQALIEYIPDLSSGVPQLDDVLVAVEFLRTRWPVLVDQHQGRFLLLNLQGLSKQQWSDDPRWSMHRGLVHLLASPVPIWLLQVADQGLSAWGLPHDPPILTEHMEAQFGWMLESYPDPDIWRAQYPQDSGLDFSPSLLRLFENPEKQL